MTFSDIVLLIGLVMFWSIVFVILSGPIASNRHAADGGPPMSTPKHEARRLGLKVYKGSPCLRGHAGLRYVSTGGCIECEGLRKRRRRKPWWDDPHRLHVSDIK